MEDVGRLSCRFHFECARSVHCEFMSSASVVNIVLFVLMLHFNMSFYFFFFFLALLYRYSTTIQFISHGFLHAQVVFAYIISFDFLVFFCSGGFNTEEWSVVICCLAALQLSSLAHNHSIR